MEIVDRIKSLVSVGTPTVAIEGARGTARAGQQVRGAAVLTGGDYDFPIPRVTIRLEEQRLVYVSPTLVSGPDRHTWGRVAELQIDLQGRVLASGERLELPFELGVPAALPASEGPVCYALIAEVGAPWFHPSATQDLKIVA